MSSKIGYPPLTLNELKLSDGKENPAYDLWWKIDKLLLTWIKATVNPSINLLFFLAPLP